MSNVALLTIYQNESFSKRIEYKDSNGSAIDFNNFHARMQIRPNENSNTIYCNLSSSMGIDGTGLNMTPLSGSVVLPKSSGSLSINISAYSSSLMDFNEAKFDLFIISGSGVSIYQDKILEGK